MLFERAPNLGCQTTATYGASPRVPFIATNTQARQIVRTLGGGQSRRHSLSDFRCPKHRQITRILGGDQAHQPASTFNYPCPPNRAHAWRRPRLRAPPFLEKSDRPMTTGRGSARMAKRDTRQQGY